MTLTPWDLAFAAIAAPLPESRFTSSRTFAPFVIACSACCCWADLSPSAFWISDSMLAASKAALRNGRSTVSQRTDDLESGSSTATLPASVGRCTGAGARAVLVVVAAARGDERQRRNSSRQRHAAPTCSSHEPHVSAFPLRGPVTGGDAAGIATSDWRAASSSAPSTSARSPSTPRVMRTSAAAEGMA